MDTKSYIKVSRDPQSSRLYRSQGFSPSGNLTVQGQGKTREQAIDSALNHFGMMGRSSDRSDYEIQLPPRKKAR